MALFEIIKNGAKAVDATVRLNAWRLAAGSAIAGAIAGWWLK